MRSGLHLAFLFTNDNKSIRKHRETAVTPRNNHQCCSLTILNTVNITSVKDLIWIQFSVRRQYMLTSGVKGVLYWRLLQFYHHYIEQQVIFCPYWMCYFTWMIVYPVPDFIILNKLVKSTYFNFKVHIVKKKNAIW